jgi:aldehyde oxidoreductase
VEKGCLSCVGKTVLKIDALDKALGCAIYSEDISYPGMLYGSVLRAGIPHALMEGIDVKTARSMKGVVRVLTAKDMRGINLYGSTF